MLDGELTHGDQQLRLKHFDFRIQPLRAARNLFAIRHPVAAPGVLARGKTTYRSDVGTLAKPALIDPNLSEPANRVLPAVQAN